MSVRCERHGNLIWPADRPFPAGDGPYCFACWRKAGGKGREGGTPKAATRPAVCGRLSLEVVRLPGSTRPWRRCGGGYGSATGDGRAGLVCGCATPSAGVWRVGRECGQSCPGFSAAGEQGPQPPADQAGGGG